MKRKMVIIKTSDTKKEYEFEVGKSDKDRPQLWEVEIKIACVDDDGSSSIDRYSENRFIYVERETLENHGLVPREIKSKEALPKKSTEDLMLEFLERVFPEK